MFQDHQLPHLAQLSQEDQGLQDHQGRHQVLFHLDPQALAASLDLLLAFQRHRARQAFQGNHPNQLSRHRLKKPRKMFYKFKHVLCMSTTSTIKT